MTVDGVEESRKVYNNSTYKASNEIYSVGLANASPEAAAAINNAIATQNEDTIRATVSQWANGARRPRPRSRRLRLRRGPRIPAGQTAGNPAAGTDQSGGQTTAQ